MMCSKCNQEVSDDMKCDCGNHKACCGGTCKVNAEGGEAPAAEAPVTEAPAEGGTSSEGGDAPAA